jgi:hypothetical protein
MSKSKAPHYVGDQGQRFIFTEKLHKDTTPEEEATHYAKLCAELFDTLQILQKRLEENPSVANAECVFAITKVYHDALRHYLFK